MSPIINQKTTKPQLFPQLAFELLFHSVHFGIETFLLAAAAWSSKNLSLLLPF